MNKRVLVTGITGFIGRHTIPFLLQRGLDVHGVSRTTVTDPYFSDVVMHTADLLRQDDIAKVVGNIKPSHVLHLAWDVTPGKYWKSPNNLDWVASSLHLVREFAKNGGTRLVSAGTCAEYDWSEETLDEVTTKILPRSPYGRAKASLKTLIDAFAEELYLSTAWGRIFFLYGPHEAAGRLVPSVITSLLAENDAPCTEGIHKRDFMYVKDVAEAFVSLLDSSVVGPVNIATGEAVSIRSIAEKIARAIKGRGKLNLGSVPLGADESMILTGTNDRLQKEVGFTPRYSLNSGLEETVAWWRARGS